jgi:hypothetical protein
MKALRRYSINHYYGEDVHKPDKLPPGDFYFAEDSKILYKYNKLGLPIPLNSGSSAIEVLFDISRDEEGAISQVVSKYGVDFPQGSVDVKDIFSENYDISPLDNDFVLDIKYDGDWMTTLPNISLVEDNSEFNISHKVNGNSTGTIVPYGADTIDGESNIKMYGTGLMTIKKIKIDEEDYKWLLLKSISYNTVHMQGKTRLANFSNQSTIQINHNLGFIPIVQVWVEDGGGGYVEANVDVDHDWDNMNSFEVQLNSIQSGKIIY